MTQYGIVLLTDEQAILAFGSYGAYVLVKAVFAAIFWRNLRKRFRPYGAIALVALPPFLDGLYYLALRSKSSRTGSL